MMRLRRFHAKIAALPLLAVALSGCGTPAAPLASGFSHVGQRSPRSTNARTAPPKAQSARRTASTSSGSPPDSSAARTRFLPLKLDEIAMQTVSDGWAVSRNQILATSDGGRRWRTVTPPGVTFETLGPPPLTFGSNFGIAWDFVGAQTAWVASTMSHPRGTFLLSHTVDGGHQWRETRIHLALSGYAWQGSHVLEVDFVNSRIGWLTVGPGPTWPQFPLQLWQTTTAGRTWHRVYETGAFGGAITFTSPADGCLVFEQQASNTTPFQLQTTTNGGRSWTSVRLPDLPLFFNYEDGSGTGLAWHGNDGAIGGSTVMYGAPRGYAAVLRTADDGRHWTLSPKLPTRNTGFTGVMTAGAATWAIVDGRLYLMPANGHRWAQRSAEPWLLQATGFDAVNGGVGFVWRTTSRGATIWRTTDSGLYWRMIKAVRTTTP